MQIKLAEALLRRKELQLKVEQLKNIKQQSFFEIKGERRKVTDGIDDIVLQVPKLYLSQVTEEYDFYARALRLIDAQIQKTNWSADVELESTTMSDYKPTRKLDEYK